MLEQAHHLQSDLMEYVRRLVLAETASRFEQGSAVYQLFVVAE